jgi:hypothetical protein
MASRFQAVFLHPIFLKVFYQAQSGTLTQHGAPRLMGQAASD